jgi:hypothetical protein
VDTRWSDSRAAVTQLAKDVRLIVKDVDGVDPGASICPLNLDVDTLSRLPELGQRGIG